MGVEFLVYDKLNWMDKLSSSELSDRVAKEPKFLKKFDARYRPGDIIEVRPIGFYTGEKARGFNRATFRVVICEAMDYEEVKWADGSWEIPEDAKSGMELNRQFSLRNFSNKRVVKVKKSKLKIKDKHNKKLKLWP